MEKNNLRAKQKELSCFLLYSIVMESIKCHMSHWVHFVFNDNGCDWKTIYFDKLATCMPQRNNFQETWVVSFNDTNPIFVLLLSSCLTSEKVWIHLHIDINHLIISKCENGREQKWQRTNKSVENKQDSKWENN